LNPQRYRGACYQAAGWQALGRTAGWVRAGKDYYEKHDRPKELWVQALHPQACAWLKAETLPEALAQAKAPRRSETRAVVTRAVKPGELPFPHVAQVARIERRREFADGRIEEETVFVVSSRAISKLSATALGKALRAHWSIENA